eukprot:38710_1
MNPTSNNKITGFSLLSPTVLNKDKNKLSVNASYHASVEFIQRAGIATKLPIKTINTAIMIFLRYFASNDIDDEDREYSINDICRCALFSASKIEETPCRLRDVMNATFKITFPDRKLPNPNTTEWHKWRENLIQLESIILNEINFEFNAVHPHQFVLHQLNDLKTSTNVAKLSWSICNDCMYSRNIMLAYQPHEISAAAIYVATEFLSHCVDSNNDEDDHHNTSNSHSSSSNSTATSPTYGDYHHQSISMYDGTKEPSWWRKFDVDDYALETICMLIMDLYEAPIAKFEDDKCYANNGEEEEENEDIDITTPSPKQHNTNSKQEMDSGNDNHQ